MLAEINPFDFLVLAELAGCPGPEYDSFVDDIGAVGHLESLPDVMVGDENSDLAIPQMLMIF